MFDDPVYRLVSAAFGIAFLAVAVLGLRILIRDRQMLRDAPPTVRLWGICLIFLFWAIAAALLLAAAAIPRAGLPLLVALVGLSFARWLGMHLTADRVGRWLEAHEPKRSPN
jgi:hypothetical protein